MPEILKKQIRQRHKVRVIRRIQVRLPDEWEAEFFSVKKDLFRVAKKKITRAFILREGGLKLLRQLRVQIVKAEQGHFHAKPRRQAVWR